jgi:hypothetical protein
MSHAAKIKRPQKVFKTSPDIFIVCKCGKKGYKTQGEAMIQALSASSSKGQPFRVYQCDEPRGVHGGGFLWHLTSKVPESQRSSMNKIDKTIGFDVHIKDFKPEPPPKPKVRQYDPTTHRFREDT